MSQTKKKRISVVVVGQTPPPYHGQAVMIEMLISHPMDKVDLHHVRMAFSEDMSQVGRFQLSKLVHLLGLILRIIWARVYYRSEVLYYPPAGPNKVPVLRDIAILLSTRWMFRKTVFHFHANGIHEIIPTLPYAIRMLARFALNKPDATIQLTEGLSADSDYFNSKQKFVVPNSVEDHRDSFVNTLELTTANGKEKPIRMLFVGTVCEGKGINTLLSACSLLKKRGFHFHLHVVGSFAPLSFEAECMESIRSKGLETSVHFVGQKTGEEKWNEYAQADLFVFPSHYSAEGFPCVLLEAMTFSLPIIATNWRGIPSIVENNVNGLLVDIRDEDLLATAIASCIENGSKRIGFGVQGRMRYDQEFSVEKHIAMMEHVFLTVTD